MFQRLRSAFTLICIIALLPLPLVAQQSPNQASGANSDAPANTMVIHASSRMVNLPVVVRNEHGKIMKNIQKEDLLLTEDGKPQTIRYFDHDTAEPLTVGLLVDVSSSEQNSLDEESNASKDFLHHMLSQQDKAFIIQFGHQVDLLSHPTGDRDILKAALAQLGQTSSPDVIVDPDAPPVHHGGTHLYDAIFLAAEDVMKPESNRKALIVLTDGEDTSSTASLDRCIEAAQRADTIVYAIFYPPRGRGKHTEDGSHHSANHFVQSNWAAGAYSEDAAPDDTVPAGKVMGNRKQHADGRAIMTRVTGETGGDIFEVTSDQTISAIYKQIAEELRTQYRLSYPPPAHPVPGLHNVTVTAKNGKLTVQTRSGYYATR